MQPTGSAPPGTQWFAFRREELLLLDEDRIAVPRASAPGDLGLETSFEREVGALNGGRCWAAELPPEAPAPAGTVFRDLRGMAAVLDEEFFRTAGAGEAGGRVARHQPFLRPVRGEDRARRRRARYAVHAVRDDALPAGKPGGDCPGQAR